MKRIFEKAFTPPFKVDKVISWVYDVNHNFCFQFEIDIEKEQARRFEHIINGISKPTKNDLYEHKDGMIKVNGENLILMRGWGHLTGIGGLNLSDEEAIAIQDDLANYLVDKLNG